MEISRIEKIARLMEELNLAKLEMTDWGYGLLFSKVRIVRRRFRWQEIENIAQQYLEPVVKPLLQKIRDSEYIEIKSDNKIPIGTFYFNSLKKRKPKIKRGRKVREGDTLGYIESLGMVIPIICQYKGIVRKVYVRNGDAVQYGSLLFRIKVDSCL